MTNYFKTDGIRGIAQVDLDPSLFYAIGGYLAIHDSRPVVVGADTRESSPLYRNALICGVVNLGGNVINLGTCTTPALSYVTRRLETSYGVMITASHNPYRYNGVKIFRSSGLKIDEETELDISRCIDSWSTQKIKSTRIGRVEDGSAYLDYYLNELTAEAQIKADRPVRLILDAANGGGYLLTHKLVQQLGLDNVVIVGDEPSGTNINRGVGALEIEKLRQKVAAEKADLGFAIDGDGDRLMACTARTIIDGDLAVYLLAQSDPERYRSGVVLTVNSNSGVVNQLEELNIPVYRTAVGDCRVLNEMKRIGAHLGGENSGHILYEQQTADGLKTFLLLLEIYQDNPRRFIRLLDKVKYYPTARLDIEVKDQEQFLCEYQRRGLEADLKSAVGEKGRVLVRASGTEKLIRFLAEAPTKRQVQRCLEMFKKFSEEMK